MIGLPRIIGSGSITADVAHNRRVTNQLGSLAVFGVVVGALVFGSLDVSELFYAPSMDLAPRLIAQCATI